MVEFIIIKTEMDRQAGQWQLRWRALGKVRTVSFNKQNSETTALKN